MMSSKQNDSFRLAQFLTDVCPNVLEIDGYIFLDREQKGEEWLRYKIGKSSSIQEAQFWINIVPISDYVCDFTMDDDPDSPSVQKILDVCMENWELRIKSKYPSANFQIEKWRDDDAGDYGVRIAKDLSFKPAKKIDESANRHGR